VRRKKMDTAGMKQKRYLMVIASELEDAATQLRKVARLSHHELDRLTQDDIEMLRATTDEVISQIDDFALFMSDD